MLLDDLDDLALSHVYSFLDMKSILSFASSSADSRLFYQDVLLSALATDDYETHKVLRETLCESLEKKSIFLPSPKRLLRLLAMDDSCESCHKKRVTAVTGGLRLCSKCSTKILWFDRKWRPWMHGSNVFIDVDEEKCGPKPSTDMDPNEHIVAESSKKVSEKEMATLKQFYDNVIKPQAQPNMIEVIRTHLRLTRWERVPYQTMVDLFQEASLNG